MKLKLIDKLFITKNCKDYLMYNPYNDAILKVDKKTLTRVKKNRITDNERNILMELGMLKNDSIDETTYTTKWLRDLQYFSRGFRSYFFIGYIKIPSVSSEEEAINLPRLSNYRRWL